MKQLSFFLITMFFYSSALFAQFPTLRTADTQWATLKNLPGKLNHYAKQGDRIFAAGNGFYKTDDLGDNWETISSSSNISSLAACDSAVIYIQYGSSIGQYGFPQHGFGLKISRDNGNTFENKAGIGGGTSIHNTVTVVSNGLKIKNDSTYYFFYSRRDSYTDWQKYFTYTSDYGETWTTVTYNPSVYSGNWVFNGDTLYQIYDGYMGISTGPNIFNGTLAGIFGLGQSGDLKAAYFHDDALQLIYESGHRLRTWDDGQNWTIDAINLPDGDLYAQENGIYRKTEDGLFKATDYDYSGWQEIYNGQLLPAFHINGLVAYEDATFINAFGGNTLRSIDDGNNWEFKMDGLDYGTSLSTIQTYQDQFWVNGLNGAIYRSTEGLSWQIYDQPAYYDLLKQIGTYGVSQFLEHHDQLYALTFSFPRKVLRSLDGDNWEISYDNPDEKAIHSLYSSGNDLFLLFSFSTSIYDLAVSEDDGATWEDHSLPSAAKEFEAIDDHWIIIRNQVDYSIQGQNWEQTFSGFMTDLFTSGDTLFGITGNEEVWWSLDKGESWEQKSVAFYTNLSGASLKGKDLIEDIFFLTYLSYNLYTGVSTPSKILASGNLGNEWLELNGLPSFSGDFFVKEEYLYLHQGSQFWRMPKDSLYQQLPGQATNGVFEGHVFRDENSDCELDTSDAPILESPLKIMPGNFYAMSDADGRFDLGLPPGLYSAEISPPLYHQMICTDTFINDIEILAGENSPVNFAMELIPDIYDLKLYLTAITAARPGFPLTFRAVVENAGTEIIDASSLEFTFPQDKLNFISTNLPSNVNGNFIEVEIGPLAHSEKAIIELNFEVEPDPGLIGETIAVQGLIYHTFPEQAPSDNFVVLTRVITGSFDPNDKQLNAPSTDASGIIPIGSHTFDYIIRFQNTGTDTAFRVIVKDYFTDKLEPLSFSTIDASHPYFCEMDRNGHMSWIFENIMLPDGNVNEPGSHGFIRFEITSEELLTDDVIANNALIYFDFNPPILTNTVTVTAGRPSYASSLQVDLCEGEVYEGEQFLQDTVLVDTVSSLLYDSVFTTSISVYLLSFMELSVDLCEGESFLFDGMELTMPGNYDAVFSNQFGCDSVIILSLDLLPVPMSIFEAEVCEGGAVVWNGELYGDAGVYEQILTAANGCDSIASLHLSVLPDVQVTQEIDLEIGMTFNNIPIFSDTTLVENLLAENGCDSMVTTYISVLTATIGLFENEWNLNIYPNPSTAAFNIEFYLPEAMEIRIETYDALGRQVIDYPHHGIYKKGKNIVELDAEKWSDGLYFLHVSNAQQQHFTKKLLKIE